MRDGVGTYTYTCTCTHHRGARVRGAEVSHSEEASLGTRSRTRRQRTINSVGDELFSVGDHIVATFGGFRVVARTILAEGLGIDGWW